MKHKYTLWAEYSFSMLKHDVHVEPMRFKGLRRRLKESILPSPLLHRAHITDRLTCPSNFTCSLNELHA
jgi:hypothetical protein